MPEQTPDNEQKWKISHPAAAAKLLLEAREAARGQCTHIACE